MTKQEELETLVEMLPKEAFTDGKRLSIELGDVIAHKLYSRPLEERRESTIDEEFIAFSIAKYMQLNPTNTFAAQYADFIEQNVLRGGFEKECFLDGSEAYKKTREVEKAFEEQISYKNNASEEVVREYNQLIDDLYEASESKEALEAFKQKYTEEKREELDSKMKSDFERYESEIQESYGSLPKMQDFKSYKTTSEGIKEMESRLSDLSDEDRDRAEHSLSHDLGTIYAIVGTTYGMATDIKKYSGDLENNISAIIWNMEDVNGCDKVKDIISSMWMMKIEKLPENYEAK